MPPIIQNTALRRTAAQAIGGGESKTGRADGTADKLALENQALQARVKSLLASPDGVEALREENALFKKQMAELKIGDEFAGNARFESGNGAGASANRDVAIGRGGEFAGKSGAGKPHQQLQTAGNPRRFASRIDGNEARIRELTQERDDLLAKLGEANKEIYGRKKQDAAAQINELTDK